MKPTNNSPDKPIVVGTIGGIASGKSNFSNILQSMGAERIDADALGHQVLKKPLVVRQLVQLFGSRILDSRGQIDRGRMAEAVFAHDGTSEARLQQLEAITHPLIHAEAVHKLSAIKQAGKTEMVVIDAPLLLEAGWAPMCHAIVFVDTPDTVRLNRAMARGWTEAHFHRRESAQMSLDEKRRKATHVVSGQWNAQETREFCNSLFELTRQSEQPSRPKVN